MSLIKSAKALFDNNLIKRCRIKRMRKQLQNQEVSLFTPNCLGGILFHDLGLRFLSPTVNLMMTQKDFLEFVLHLDEYLNGNFEFVEKPEYECPCAYLYRGTSDEKIMVVFTHYKTAKEALDKWNSRKERIDKDNMFVFIEERDGITKHDLEKLASLKVKGIVAFTCNEYKDIPYAVYLPKYHKDGEVGNILKKNHITGRREYEKYFDFVKWFNEADGAPYTTQEFCK